MASLCHPWFTTTNLSYRFPIFETSATALCGTTGTSIIDMNMTLWSLSPLTSSWYGAQGPFYFFWYLWRRNNSWWHGNSRQESPHLGCFRWHFPTRLVRSLWVCWTESTPERSWHQPAYEERRKIMWKSTKQYKMPFGSRRLSGPTPPRTRFLLQQWHQEREWFKRADALSFDGIATSWHAKDPTLKKKSWCMCHSILRPSDSACIGSIKWIRARWSVGT